MPTRIKYYKQDPNGKGRGAGVYYHRGNEYFSKYSRQRDYDKLSKGWQTDRVGLPKKTRLPHVTDGVIEYILKGKKR